jgi:hypothetical protein
MWPQTSFTDRRSSQSWNQQDVQHEPSFVTAGGRQAHVPRPTALEAGVPAQSGSSYLGTNRTRDRDIIQVSNISANIIQIGSVFPNPSRKDI